MNRLFIIDLMPFLYRGHFVFLHSPRMTKSGINTSALIGLVSGIQSIFKRGKPTHAVFAMDPAGPTFRHLAYPAYKAQREKMPEDIAASIGYAQELAAAVNEIKTSKFIDLFNEWAKNCGVPVAKYLDSADTYAGILFETDHDELAPCFEFGTSGFRNFYFGLILKSGMNPTDARKYNSVSGWNRSEEWWPYYKYFEGEFRNPGENLDFLGDGKPKLFAAMDRALRELRELTPSRIC